MDGENTCN